jgi:hypothetical protein
MTLAMNNYNAVAHRSRFIFLIRIDAACKVRATFQESTECCGIVLASRTGNGCQSALLVIGI